VPFELTMIGDGPRRPELERESQALDLDRRVRFVGALANEDVIRILRESDVFLSVSAFEGLSIGMLEAMANHVVPVVSATRSGTPQVIQSERNGLIAPVGDIAAFADHLARIAGDPIWLRSMADAAFRTIVDQQLTTDAMVDSYVDLFRTVVEQPFVRQPGELLVPAHLRPELRAGNEVRRIISKPVRMLRYWVPRLLR
jgi:glycosyltransferase involved in cell wall biosynthesis